MLTGTYILQTSKAKFGQAVDGTYQMCMEEDEDLVHVLLRCPAIQNARNKQLPRFMKAIPHVLNNLAHALNDPKLLIQLIMDPTHPSISNHISIPPQCEEGLERSSRNICYSIHSGRCLKLCI